MDIIYTVLIIGVIGAAIVVATIYLIKRFERTIQTGQERSESALVTELRSQIDEKLTANKTEVTEATKRVEERLTQASSYIMELNKEVGQMRELGKSVKDFQDLFLSQKTRGVAGEQFLGDILKAILPAALFELQYGFQDGSRVDAVIKLKDELIPIDAKFPLENYRLFVRAETEAERAAARREFARDVKTHIDSISKKYILPHEGSIDGAVMYVPVESVYAAICEDEGLIGYAQTRKIWISSPNTIYQLLQIAISVYQRNRAGELVGKALQAIGGVQEENKKFGVELGKLTTHITNAKNMSDTVNNRFQKLTNKIENVTALEIEEAKLITESVDPAVPTASSNEE